MKAIIPKRSHAVAVILTYLVLPFLGWRVAGYLGIPAGLGFAYLVDRLYPRSSVGVEWDDFHRGVQNFIDYGIVGSRMFLNLQNRRFILFRGSLAGKLRLGVQFRREEWEDCLSEEEVQALLREWGGSLFDARWHGREYCYLAVSRRKDICDALESLTKTFLAAADARLQDVPIRIDFAKRNIWGEYGRDDGASRADT